MQSQWLIAGQRSEQFGIQDEPPEQKEEKEKEGEEKKEKKSKEAKEKSKEKPSVDEKKKEKSGDEKKKSLTPMKIDWNADMTAMGPAPSEGVIDQSHQAINGFDLRSGPPINVIVAPLVFEMDPAGQRESFVLQNNETKEIAFKVKTNDNKRLRIHPVCDYVPPGKTKKILITLLSGRNAFLRIDVVLAPYKFGAASAKDNVDSTVKGEQSRISIRLFAMKIEDVPVEKKGEKEKEKEQGKENSSKKHSRKKKKGDQSSKKNSKSRKKKKSGVEKKEEEQSSGDNSDKHSKKKKRLERNGEKEQGSKDNSSREHSRKRNKAEKNDGSKKHHSQSKSRKKREKKENEQPSTDNNDVNKK